MIFKITKLNQKDDGRMIREAETMHIGRSENENIIIKLSWHYSSSKKCEICLSSVVYSTLNVKVVISTFTNNQISIFLPSYEYDLKNYPMLPTFLQYFYTSFFFALEI